MDEFEIYFIASFDDWLLDEIARLMPQLTSAPAPDRHLLNQVLGDQNEMVIVVKKENPQNLVGFGTLCVYVSPSGYHAHIEDVVVDDSERGKGVGEEIIKALLSAAADKGYEGVSLTCNPRREEANRLYQKMGFKKWDTNNYWFDLL